MNIIATLERQGKPSREPEPEKNDLLYRLAAYSLADAETILSLLGDRCAELRGPQPGGARVFVLRAPAPEARPQRVEIIQVSPAVRCYPGPSDEETLAELEAAGLDPLGLTGTSAAEATELAKAALAPVDVAKRLQNIRVLASTPDGICEASAPAPARGPIRQPKSKARVKRLIAKTDREHTALMAALMEADRLRPSMTSSERDEAREAMIGRFKDFAVFWTSLRRKILRRLNAPAKIQPAAGLIVSTCPAPSHARGFQPRAKRACCGEGSGDADGDPDPAPGRPDLHPSEAFSSALCGPHTGKNPTPLASAPATQNFPPGLAQAPSPPALTAPLSDSIRFTFEANSPGFDTNILDGALAFDASLLAPEPEAALLRQEAAASFCRSEEVLANLDAPVLLSSGATTAREALARLLPPESQPQAPQDNAPSAFSPTAAGDAFKAAAAWGKSARFQESYADAVRRLTPDLLNAGYLWYLLPEWQRGCGRFGEVDLSGPDGESLTFTVDRDSRYYGRWISRATGNHGDLFDLTRQVHRLGEGKEAHAKAMALAEQFLAPGENIGYQLLPRATEDFPAFSVAEVYPKKLRRISVGYGPFWHFHLGAEAPGGGTLASFVRVLRCYLDREEKLQTRAYTFSPAVRLADNKKVWLNAEPLPTAQGWPLWGLNYLRGFPDKPRNIALVAGDLRSCGEAQKHYELLREELFGGRAFFTFGFAGSAQGTDWAPLGKFSRIVIWPSFEAYGKMAAREIEIILTARHKVPEEAIATVPDNIIEHTITSRGISAADAEGWTLGDHLAN